ncbi:MAG: hypothetical protein IT431_07315 [Phycisphaerales bacterium]|nr:hypothetical protein [Phycisphaerales bacterium]
MRRARFLRLPAGLLMALASAAQADKTINGSVSGYVFAVDEDVSFTGDVTLTGPLSVYVYNGNIYTSGCNLIDGTGADGDDGTDGEYVFNMDTYETTQPTAGEGGYYGASLTLVTYEYAPYDSANTIYLDAPIYLNGGSGGEGGKGQDGILAIALDPCLQLEPYPGSGGGTGGVGGSLTIQSAGDVYLRDEVDCSGGKGGNGGDGGYGGYPDYGSLVPASPNCGDGGHGGGGGDSGGISVTATGDIYLNGAALLTTSGNSGGGGGDGGGDGSPTGSGGGGGSGGDGGAIEMYGATITGSFPEFIADSGIGGTGGTGGGEAGPAREQFDQTGCTPNGGCSQSETIERDRGAMGGGAGTVGLAGIIDLRAPTSSMADQISLLGLVVSARPSGQNSKAGGTGTGGLTSNNLCANCWDDDPHDGQVAAMIPRGGTDGTIGGDGGTIYFQCYYLVITDCDLDVRGGKGGDGGRGGDGDCPDTVVCWGEDGGAGGLGGAGGDGGFITYDVTVISGSGGVARKCSGAGGTGGRGGDPEGYGGNGNTNGTIGVIYDYSNSGTPPSSMLCTNTPPHAGDDGDDCE